MTLIPDDSAAPCPGAPPSEAKDVFVTTRPESPATVSVKLLQANERLLK